MANAIVKFLAVVFGLAIACALFLIGLAIVCALFFMGVKIVHQRKKELFVRDFNERLPYSVLIWIDDNVSYHIFPDKVTRKNIYFDPDKVTRKNIYFDENDNLVISVPYVYMEHSQKRMEECIIDIDSSLKDAKDAMERFVDQVKILERNHYLNTYKDT